MQRNQSLGQIAYEKNFGVNFGYQLYDLLKILKCYGIQEAEDAMILLFLLKEEP